MLKMFYPTQDCLVNEAVCRNKTFIISFLHLLSCMTGPLLLLLREIVLIHPHYKLTSWRPANLSSVFWDPHLCFLNHVSEHLSWDLTTVLTALSFFSCVCAHVVWCGEGTPVHSHNHNLGLISSKDEQIKAALPARGHFIKSRHPAIWSQTNREPTPL